MILLIFKRKLCKYVNKNLKTVEMVKEKKSIKILKSKFKLKVIE